MPFGLPLRFAESTTLEIRSRWMRWMKNRCIHRAMMKKSLMMTCDWQYFELVVSTYLCPGESFVFSIRRRGRMHCL